MSYIELLGDIGPEAKAAIPIPMREKSWSGSMRIPPGKTPPSRFDREAGFAVKKTLQ